MILKAPPAPRRRVHLPATKMSPIVTPPLIIVITRHYRHFTSDFKPCDVEVRGCKYMPSPRDSVA